MEEAGRLNLVILNPGLVLRSEATSQSSNGPTETQDMGGENLPTDRTSPFPEILTRRRVSHISSVSGWVQVVSARGLDPREPAFILPHDTASVKPEADYFATQTGSPNCPTTGLASRS